MALFQSEKGYFEVTAVSFSPKIITVGEETKYSITIKNVSGKKISSMYVIMELLYPDVSGRMSRSTSVYAHGGPAFAFASTSWAANASKTFTGTFKFTTSNYHTYLPNITTRLMPGSMMIDITTNATFADGSNHDIINDVRGANSEYLIVIDSRYNPTIAKFEGERSDTDGALNDEGLALLSNIALATSTTAKPESLSLKAYFLNELAPDEAPVELNLTSLRDSALAAEIQTVIDAVELNTNADYTVTLWFGDQYESTTATILISRAFANMHLSGLPTGGACFGGFSRSTEQEPLLESYYKIVPYNGIRGVTDYSEEEVATGGIWYDGKPIYRRSFAVSNGAAKTHVSLGSISNFSKPVSIQGYVYHDDRYFSPSMYYNSTFFNRTCVTPTGGVQVYCTASFSAVVTVEYTKSTD